MTYKEIQQEKIVELEKVLRSVFVAEVFEKGDLRDVYSIARRLVEKHVSVEDTATWIREESNTSKNKVIYRCSHCGHWKALNKSHQDAIVYYHHCDFCGRRMNL